MTYDPDRHHRRSIRLKGYDYAEPGAYFVTICVQDRVCLFGEVVDGETCLNDAGRMVQAVWNELPVFYAGVDVDEFVVMPNHVHGIVELVGYDPDAGHIAPGGGGRGRPRGAAPTGESGSSSPSVGAGPCACPGTTTHTVLSLPDVVHRFKTLTTKRYADGVRQAGWPPFNGRLWQRNYYEHVVRNDASLERLRNYIFANPSQWPFDQENPTRSSGG